MSRFDRLALTASVVVAALLRLPGIEARGRFDADQGHDMLTLLALTGDGVIPLLGPKTSAGDFHHGAMYYFLLAPASAISNADPVVVTMFLALLGIAAVALTWWLGRAIGGAGAGAVAGMLMAVSPAGIDESTFIWNPNAIAFFAALAFAAAWRAKSGGRRAWWSVSLVAAGMVVQLHILGAIFFLEMLEIAALEIRRDRAVLRPFIVGLGLAALLFVPLLASELRTDFAETRGVLAYFGGAGGAGDGNLPFAIAVTVLRVVGWPLVGSVVDTPVVAAVLLAVTVAGAVLAFRLVAPRKRTAVRWFVGLVIWSTIALALAAPSLIRVVPGLPNDHYHAFLDPVVILLVAVPLGILLERSLAFWRSSPASSPLSSPLSARRSTAALAPATVGLGIVALLATALLRMPPPVDPDGGWPAMRDAGARIAAIANGRTIQLWGLPDFKLVDAVGFPVVKAGGHLAGGLALDLTPQVPEGLVVIACDRLFEAAIGASCGGPAEDAHLSGFRGGVWSGTPLLDRFQASPRTWISIYGQPAS